MIGNTESIAVAPATETDSNEPIFLAITGIKNMANSSLNILDKKAIPPNSTLTFDSSIAEKEYQPIPALTAIVSGMVRDRNNSCKCWNGLVFFLSYRDRRAHV